MKKKYFMLISMIVIVSLITAFVIYGFVYKTSVDAESEQEEVEVTWSVEKYVEEEKDSDVDSNAKKIDCNPDSITVLVNKEYSIDEDYKPDDLVEPNIKFSFNYKDEKRKLRKEAAQNLELLFEGAKYYGYELEGVSGYRSYERQKTIYEYNLLRSGFEYTQVYSAMPGTSEHQTGLAIDITCPSLKGTLSDSFGDTPEGKWIEKNSYKYGYIVRYPKNKSDITGYGYEPWHIRYVGYDLAKYLYDEKLTLDEYYSYKVDLNMVNREAYAYYDYLLTMKKGGYTNISNSVLDDVLDNKSVDVSNADILEDKKDDEDIDDIDEEVSQTIIPSSTPVVTKSPTTPVPNILKPTSHPTVDTPAPMPNSTVDSGEKQTARPDGS